MTESKVGGLPPLPDIGPEGWYTRTDMIAYARAALSAHGQPVVDEAMVKRAVDATAPPDRTRLDHEEYAEAILTAALGDTP